MPKSRIFNVANMPFNAIRENKILAKTSEFTVCTCINVSRSDTMFLLTDKMY